MPKEPVFDPRHDAVFQRGYEAGAAPRAGRPAQPDAPAPAGEPPAALNTPPAADALRQNPAGPSDADRPAPPPAELADAPLLDAPLLDAALLDAALVPRTRSAFNPFIIALWIIGPALSVGGVWLQVRVAFFSAGSTGTSFNAGEVPWDVVFQQLVWTLTPTMISAGVMTMLGLLFWHAWQWRSARR